jgi:hypothetical protein
MRLVVHPEASSSTSPPKRRKTDNASTSCVDVYNLMEEDTGPLPQTSMMQISQFLGVKELMSLAVTNQFWLLAVMKILDARLAARKKEKGQIEVELVEALSFLCRAAPDSLTRR